MLLSSVLFSLISVAGERFSELPKQLPRPMTKRDIAIAIGEIPQNASLSRYQRKHNKQQWQNQRVPNKKLPINKQDG